MPRRRDDPFFGGGPPFGGGSGFPFGGGSPFGSNHPFGGGPPFGSNHPSGSGHPFGSGPPFGSGSPFGSGFGGPPFPYPFGSGSMFGEEPRRHHRRYRHHGYAQDNDVPIDEFLRNHGYHAKPGPHSPGHYHPKKEHAKPSSSPYPTNRYICGLKTLGWDRDHKARLYLEWLAAIVRPIMKRRGYRVKLLEESYGTQNYGFTVRYAGEHEVEYIEVQLCSNSDRNVFMSKKQIVETILHEPVLCENMNHDQKFWDTLKELRKEFVDRYGENYTQCNGIMI